MVTPDGTRNPARRKKSQGAIERTLAGISASLEDSLFAEQIGRQRGLLQSLDPRLKVAATLLLLIAVGLSHSLAIIAALYGFALLLRWDWPSPATGSQRRCSCCCAWALRCRWPSCWCSPRPGTAC
jgi:hypothetical protein